MSRIAVLATPAAALLAGLLLAYANHFDNGFHFDDSHTIVNNLYIRDLGNVASFFTDTQTFSSKPGNQSYRPMMTLLSAVDYALAGGKLNPFWFHLDTFAWYLAQLALMYVLILHLFHRARRHRWNPVAALLCVAFYGFHAANAETLNYVSARSDSISTFWLIAALVTYLRFPRFQWRGFGLFLLPLLLGLLSKQSVLVFPALLFMFVLLFEGTGDRGDLGPRHMLSATSRVGAALVVCVLFFWFQAAMEGNTYAAATADRFHYFITQPWVMLHYTQNFLLPVQLAVDSDLTPFDSLLDPRVWAGAAFVAAMLWVAWTCLFRMERRPIAFGIAWFFIALAPASSGVVVLTQVMNDHRTFFPFIGLAIALSWAIALWVYRLDATGSFDARSARLIPVLVAVILVLHGVGVHARSTVWGDGELLWKDAVTKAPGNGRNWMNYGVALMAKGRYEEARFNFERALELWPTYSYIHINLAIVKAAMGGHPQAEIESHYQQAVRLFPTNPEGHYRFARYLASLGRDAEAIQHAERALDLSDAHFRARSLLLSLLERTGDGDALAALAQDTLRLLPQDDEAKRALDAADDIGLRGARKRAAEQPGEATLLTLSHEYFRAGDYARTIEAANQLLELRGSTDAGRAAGLNNACIARIRLGQFEAAVEACRRALQARPTMARARANLAYARDLLAQRAPLDARIASGEGAPAYRALSLFFYDKQMFHAAVEAADRAIESDSQDAAAHNYACASLNQLGRFDEAIVHCEKALVLRPDYTLARNNLNWARSEMR